MEDDPIITTGPARAFVLFRSGGRLDLLNPRFDCWTDEDLAHWHEARARRSVQAPAPADRGRRLERRPEGLSPRRSPS